MTSMFDQAYAEIYDVIGQSAFSMRMASQVLQWIDIQNNNHTPHPLRVLDLACGTGAAARVFALAGCQVVGVDLSQAMIHQARCIAERAGQSIIWLHSDIRQLTPAWLSEQGIQAPFDLITCFNGLPYLREDDDMLQVCLSAVRLLQPGGYYIFDLTDEVIFTTEDTTDRVLYSTNDYMVYQRLSYDVQQRQGQRRTGWFTREIDRWWRSEETHLERCWREQDVQAAVQSVAPGFQIVTRLHTDRDPINQFDQCTVYFMQLSIP